MKTQFVILNLLFIIMWSCSPTESVFKDEEITLEVDAEVIENWITLRAEPVKPGFTYVLMRDTVTVFEGTLDKADTLIHDETLEPATTYTYSVFAKKGKVKSKTVMAIATTMDTTSHDFTWQTFEFGGRSSSILNDVAIINENDIWAVGEIHTQDTDKWNEDSTAWIPGYNAIHWDGSDWELKRFKVNNSLIQPIRGILPSSNNEFWIAAGSIYHSVGQSASLLYQRNINTSELVQKLLKVSDDNIYGVGTSGLIVQYNGANWKKIESGTDIDIRDIYGAQNPKTGEYEILGVASNVNKDTQIKFFQIKDNKVIDLSLDGLTYFFDGIWFKPNSKYYIVGTGIFKNNRFFKTQSWETYAPGVVSSYHTRAIAANDINDIIAVGAYNEVVHFNGKTWKNYKNNIFAAYYEVDFKNNIVAAVGFNDRNAQLLIGRR